MSVISLNTEDLLADVIQFNKLFDSFDPNINSIILTLVGAGGNGCFPFGDSYNSDEIYPYGSGGSGAYIKGNFPKSFIYNSLTYTIFELKIDNVGSTKAEITYLDNSNNTIIYTLKAGNGTNAVYNTRNGNGGTYSITEKINEVSTTITSTKSYKPTFKINLSIIAYAGNDGAPIDCITPDQIKCQYTSAGSGASGPTIENESTGQFFYIYTMPHGNPPLCAIPTWKTDSNNISGQIELTSQGGGNTVVPYGYGAGGAAGPLSWTINGESVDIGKGTVGCAYYYAI